MRPVDAAYEVLKSAGQPLPVYDLIEQVLEMLQEEPEPRRMAQIYSDINLDVRFVYRGDGQWGLRDWAPRGGPARGGGGSTAKERFRPEEEVEELEEEEGWE
jgi:DNA-directed RNA polymerase subunit delta